MNFIATLKSLCAQAVELNFGLELAEIYENPEKQNKLTLPNKSALIEITQATQKQFGHYQCNSAMKLAKLLKKPPREIASAIEKSVLEQTTNDEVKIFESIEIAGPGFINFTLSIEFITQQINNLLTDERQGIPKVEQPKRVIVDFSSPNIAKEMHVGHLRSTIIGDCLARILSFVGHDVLRLNHVGDWGTQFGMLIAYLKEIYPGLATTTPEQVDINLDLSELLACYKQAKVKFDSDAEFKTTSQQEVVKLQAKDPLAIAIWKEICYISSLGYREIYNLLGIEITDRGESFYNDSLPKIVALLEQKGIITVSDGAKCVYLDGFVNRDGDPLPLIIQKQDGAYNYATTDLAAIYHRINEEQGDWLIYVVDSGQAQHFEMVFGTAQKAELYPAGKVSLAHIPFGLVLGPDGKKFRTRAGETEKLIDLITTAISKAKGLLQQRAPELTVEELTTLARQLGINAIKYADLSNNRTSDYTFSYERMLQFEGNTAAFLSYAYVRIQSIKRKIGINLEELLAKAKIELNDPAEIDLALHICQFADCLQATVKELLPNRLTDYLFRLSEKFHFFFHNCRVEGAAEQSSRLLLCEATSQVLTRGFALLGLTPLTRM